MKKEERRYSRFCGSYGVDSPRLIVFFFLCAAIGVVTFFLCLTGSMLIFKWAAFVVFWVFFLSGLLLTCSSKISKLYFAAQLIEKLSLKGDEHALDVGCGRGLFLILLAKKLFKGSVYGVDIWQTKDQSGNRREATLLNVKKEGVLDRVSIVEGDMRQLPFEENRFDLVISCLAVHNVPSSEQRAEAIREMARVTKPGGELILIDFYLLPQHAKVLRKEGWREIVIRKPTFMTFPPLWVLHAKKGNYI